MTILISFALPNYIMYFVFNIITNECSRNMLLWCFIVSLKVHQDLQCAMLMAVHDKTTIFKQNSKDISVKHILLITFMKDDQLYAIVIYFENIPRKDISMKMFTFHCEKQRLNCERLL